MAAKKSAKKPTKKATKAAKPKAAKTVKTSDRPRCGLCGKTKNLTKTECCDNWICDDEHKYVMFSYARNSCHRNHRRYTLCANHYDEGHSGDWKDCPKCRKNCGTKKDCDIEMYVWYGTNEFNFEKLPNPPKYKPTLCAGCGKAIRLGADGFSSLGGKYYCARCTDRQMGEK